MKLNKITINALAVLMLATTSYARIGETFEECVDRYGEPVNIVQETKQAYFEVGGLLIGAGFFEGKCDFLYFSKSKLNGLGIGEKFSNTELTVLMEASSDGQPWDKMNSSFGALMWQSDELDCFARYDSLEHYLIIATKDYMKREAEAKEEEDRNKLKGF
jgi:hypothetical protein